MLRELSKDPTDNLKWAIASNRNTPPDVFRELVNWKTSWGGTCYSNIAYNPSAPEDVLRAISKSSEYATLSNLADNPNTPFDILQELARNSNKAVSFKAQKALASRHAQ